MHTYKITLEANQFIHVIVEQISADVVVTLSDPEGKKLVEADTQLADYEPEQILLIVKTPGDYRLEVRQYQKDAPPGKHRLRVVELMAVTSRAEDLIKAHEQYDKVLRLKVEGQIKETIQPARLALELFERTLGPDHPQVGRALNLLGEMYGRLGEYEQAEPLHLRAQKIFEKAPASDRPHLARALNYLAIIYNERGAYGKAEALHRRALATRERSLKPGHLEIAEGITNLAFVNFNMGNYTEAERLYQSALNILKTQQDAEIFYATVLSNLAGLYETRGDSSRAEELFNQSLDTREKLFGPDHMEVAFGLNNLAGSYMARGEYEKAEAAYKRALAIFEKGVGPGHPFVAAQVNNLAGVRYEMGNAEQAEELFQRALAMYEKVLGPGHPSVAKTLNNLADVLRAKGEYAKAAPLYLRSLSIRENALGPKHPLVAASLHDLAVFYQAQGDLTRATQFSDRAAEVSETNIARNLVAGSQRQKVQYLSTISGQTSSAISLHLRAAPDSPAVARLALTTILRRKGRVLDVMAGGIASVRQSLSPGDRELMARWAEANVRLASQVFKQQGGAVTLQDFRLVRSLEEQVERLESEITLRSTELRVQFQPVTLEAVQAAIPRDAALVEFIRYSPFNPKYTKPDEQFGSQRYAAYVLRSAGEPSWVELGEAKPIDEAVASFRAVLRDPRREDLKPISRALDERIMRPIRRLTGSTRKLLISPDDALNLIPFSALVDEGGRYLVEGYSISYLTSGRDLLRLQDEQPSRGLPIVIANPKYDLGVSSKAAAGRRPPEYGERFAPLSSAAMEAAVLRRLLRGGRVLTGAQASETSIKRLKGPKILHIATHGFFLPNVNGRRSTTGTGGADRNPSRS